MGYVMLTIGIILIILILTIEYKYWDRDWFLVENWFRKKR